MPLRFELVTKFEFAFGLQATQPLYERSLINASSFRWPNVIDPHRHFGRPEQNLNIGYVSTPLRNVKF